MLEFIENHIQADPIDISEEAVILFQQAVKYKFHWDELTNIDLKSDVIMSIRGSGYSYFADFIDMDFTRQIASPFAMAECITLRACVAASEGNLYGINKERGVLGKELERGLAELFPDIWTAKANGMHNIYEDVKIPHWALPVDAKNIEQCLNNINHPLVQNLNNESSKGWVTLDDEVIWFKADTFSGGLKIVPLIDEPREVCSG